MPTPQVPAGYILIKEACKRFNRSHRQLNRDRVKAMNLRDGKVLSHFKLQLENGRVFKGGELTVDEVSRLRDDGKNPVWFVEEAWMEETFGIKGQRPPNKSVATTAPATAPTRKSTEEGTPSSQSVPPPHEVDILRDQLEREQNQNQLLVEQLKIKDEQIKAGNELARENQELTKQLHLLLANLQRSLTSGSALIATTVTPTQASDGNSGASDIKSPDAVNAKTETDQQQPPAQSKPNQSENQKPEATAAHAETKNENSKPKVQPTTKRTSKTKRKPKKKSQKKGTADKAKPSSPRRKPALKPAKSKSQKTTTKGRRQTKKTPKSSSQPSKKQSESPKPSSTGLGKLVSRLFSR